MNSSEGPILRPVILAVPEHVRELTPRQRNVFLSTHARKALQLSAQKSGIQLGVLPKDAEGVPQPSGGFYWSITHKGTYVAGVASPHPVGIDVEGVRTTREGLYRRVADEEEWSLMPDSVEKEAAFFRFWTAKEAVMKAAGTGIKDLSRIKVRAVQDNNRIRVALRGKKWWVEQFYFDNHIAAVAAEEFSVKWSLAASKGGTEYPDRV